MSKAALLDPNRLRELLKPDAPKIISVPRDQIIYTKKNRLFDALRPDNLPQSYTTNSAKEELVLEYVEDFRRQFVSLFPDRSSLLLCPFNECGVRKFICSSIRPTLLPFQELHNLQACAMFVSDFLEYLALDNPVEFPDILPSLTTMLQTRAGDCLDFSVFLCSLLRGAGYNAYVVTGYAPKSVTMLDLSDNECPLLEYDQDFTGSDDVWWGFDKYAAETQEELNKKGFDKYRIGGFGSLLDKTTQPRVAVNSVVPVTIEKSLADTESKVGTDVVATEEEEDIPNVNRYKIDPPPVHNSRFIERLEYERLGVNKLKQRDAEIEAKAKEKVTRDLLEGDRVHCWVMVLPGKRLIKEPVFIEPTSGAIYPFSHCPYSGVESVFNESNYWVNLQPQEDGITKLTVDLQDTKKWEFVVIPDKDVMDNIVDIEKNSFSDETPLSLEQTVVDAPQSWVHKPVISREDYKQCYPAQKKIMYYRDCVVEKYAEYYPNLQGLVLQLQLFAPGSRARLFSSESNVYPEEIRAVFKHRQDKLLRRCTYPNEERIHEFYGRGREGGLMEYVQVTSKQRMFKFYPKSRVDGMVMRLETVGVKVVELYEKRHDNLSYRSISVDHQTLSAPKHTRSNKTITIALGRGNELPIKKITEKFTRNLSVSAEVDVRKRTHLLIDQLIKTDFHYAPNSIQHSVEIFDKEDRLDARLLLQMPGKSQQAIYDTALAASGATVPVANAKSKSVESHVDPEWEPLPPGEKKMELQQLMARERWLINDVREREKKLADMLQKLEHEKHQTTLSKDMYLVAKERVDNGEDPYNLTKQTSNENGDKGNSKNDFLAPFLVGFPAGQSLTKQQAQQVKDRCLAALKERLLERANVIQAHLDAENQKLHHAQLQFKRNAGNGSVDKDEELAKIYEQAVFKIEILKTRLRLHEEASIGKYVALDQKLNQHPSLQSLWKSEN